MTWGLILAGSVLVGLLPTAILNREEIRSWAVRLVRDRVRVAGVVGMSVGLAVMWFGIQTADEVQSSPTGKFEVAHFIETGWWVNPHLLLIGAAILFVAVPFATRGLARYSLGVLATLVVVAAWAIAVARPDFILSP